MIAQQTGPAASMDVGTLVELSDWELYRLTLYKWRYTLEALGFEPDAVKDLLFLKWLSATSRFEP